MSCGGCGGDRWGCAKAATGGVAVNLQKVGSMVRDIGEPCLSQSSGEVSVAPNKVLKPDKWNAIFGSDGKVLCFHKALKRIVLGGVDPSIRPQVWEFLLGCYALRSTTESRMRLRTARRERYEELIKQCQMMHSSIGTGSLAYVVGSKVMDVRAIPKENGARESIASSKASVDASNTVEGNCLRNNGTDSSLALRSESSSDSGDLVSVRRSAESAAYDSSLSVPTSDSKNHNTTNGGREADGSCSVNESYYNFPPLPVTDLFAKNEKDKREGDTTNGILSRRKLRFKDDKMHNFQISNNDELIMESNNVPHSETETEYSDVPNPVFPSADIDKKKEVVNRMRISDVPDMEFVEGSLLQTEAVSQDKVSEWLWTLHRIVVDVVRTDSHLEFYEDTKNLARMSDILAVYAWVDPGTGYCQGMSDLLSPFIVLYEDDADAFWCFEMLLRRMRENFQIEGPTRVMKQLEQLSKILELTDREIFAHLSHIGAESLHFAFRMLLVLFRRELPFYESLSMWEMMWAADFDESMANNLEENCLEALNVQIQKDLEPESTNEGLESCSNTTKNSLQTCNDKNDDFSMSNETGMKAATNLHLCGLTRNFWSRNGAMEFRTSDSSSKNRDDELPVFCVAAILVINRQKIIQETHSIDDMIKMFNDKILRINAKRCVRIAIKLRKKYLYKRQR